jgi:acetoacetate decarboxylase
MPLTNADYADIKRRLAADTLSVAVLHVKGTADATNFQSRQPLRLGNGTGLGSFLFSGTGVPLTVMGRNGDYYFRNDGGAGTCMYQKRAGSWVATGA